MFSLLATALMLVLLWAIRRATSYVLDHLQTRVLSANENTRLRWAAHGWLLVKRVAQLLLLTSGCPSPTCGLPMCWRIFR